MRAAEKGKAQYQRSGDALDALIAGGAPLDTPIPLRDGSAVVIRDLLAGGKTGGFHATMFRRYKLEPWREPKAPKANKGGVEQ